MLLAAVLVVEPVGIAVAELSTVDTVELEEIKLVGNATSTVVGLPSLRVLTMRAAVGWLDEDVDVVESLLANGPADALRIVLDMAKNVARREVTRIVNSEGREYSRAAVNSKPKEGSSFLSHKTQQK